jgi:hypothetical protein
MATWRDDDNWCRYNAYGCTGEDHKTIAHCYSCGEEVCRGPECSKRVRYKHARNNVVRMCMDCVEDRASYGELPDFTEGIPLF